MRVLSVTTIVTVLFTLPMVGCDPPNAVFVTSEQTQNLIREARRPVEETLVDHFGTPNELVAWQRFPIDYGGYPGEVVVDADGAEPASNQFRAAFQLEEATGLESGSKLLWLAGSAYEGISVTFVEYDADTQLVTIRENLEEPPAAGDSFIVEPGQVMRYGQKLYMTHCMHCHGVSGDGNGPTAPYLNPKPRDYRLGIFKFTSTTQTEKANRDDLVRIIKQGIPGTYMPSFMLLTDEESHAIVEYIRWLAIRGELEKRMNDELGMDYSTENVRLRIEGGESRSDIVQELSTYLEEEFPYVVDGAATAIAANWERADDESSVVVPSIPRVPDSEESRVRGRALYLSDKAKCATCHGVAGYGDGPQVEAYQKIPGTSDEFPTPGLYDTWGNLVKPRDLTRGLFRGGRRPIDVYRRIYAGIKGTPMPAFGGTVLSDEEVWDLVNYVMHMPFEDRSPRKPSHPEPLAIDENSAPDEEVSQVAAP